jgi:isopentenyldiphosphate isomerase
MDELVDLLDSKTKLPTGEKVSKYFAHANGLWHLASHIWVYNSKGEILLHLRSRKLKIMPGVWGTSAAGHVGAGETPLSAAVREMAEEIGVYADAKDLKFLTTRELTFENYGINNKELVYVFLYKYDGRIDNLKLGDGEVECVKFVSVDFLRKELSSLVTAKNYGFAGNPELNKVYEIVLENAGH